ncbi:hypothetical protein EAH89_15275 [Roseomonas nepalensis]|uniref:ATP synthase F0 subunit B n=1 Tax=Muricoccus nepalensis TaxID=1854500 RepID=A0A502FWE9_9PROT|nr:hypothetical protein [Roseomonas nepalensis]TPG53804.1 hypothetical protein EAH89_15275 [Roseomonas nepalensis]
MSDLSRDGLATDHAGQRPLQEARDDLRAAASEAGAKAAEAKDELGRQAGSVLDEAKAQGADIADAARGRAEDLAEQGKAIGAERAQGLAQAVRHVADDLEGSSPEIARHVRAAAESVEGVSAALRERSVGDLINEIGGFARRQPGAFFGAALVAGFAISRFAKSSAEASPAGAGQDTAARGTLPGTGRMTLPDVNPHHPAVADNGPSHTTASGAPGWVPEVGAAITASHRSHPATIAAASLGGAVAHRAGDAQPGSMPVDPSAGPEVATIPPVPDNASTVSAGTETGRTA